MVHYRMEREEILARIDDNVEYAQEKMEYYIKTWNSYAAKKCSEFVDFVYEYDTDEMSIPQLKGFLIETNRRVNEL